MKHKYLLDTKLKRIEKDIKIEQSFMDKYQMKHSYSSFMEKMSSLERKKKNIGDRNTTRVVSPRSNDIDKIVDTKAVTPKIQVPVPEKPASPKEKTKASPKKAANIPVAQPSPSNNHKVPSDKPEPSTRKVEKSIPEIKRQIIPTIQPSIKVEKKTPSKFQQSLDDFFSDEDEEDYNYNAAPSRNSKSKNAQVYYDDEDDSEDDSDDDFYYDDNGTRHEHT